MTYPPTPEDAPTLRNEGLHGHRALSQDLQLQCASQKPLLRGALTKLAPDRPQKVVWACWGGGGGGHLACSQTMCRAPAAKW